MHMTSIGDFARLMGGKMILLVWLETFPPHYWARAREHHFARRLFYARELSMGYLPRSFPRDERGGDDSDYCLWEARDIETQYYAL